MRYYTTTAIAAAATTEFLAFDSWALFFPLNSALVGSLRALNFFHFFIFVFLLFFVIFRVVFFRVLIDPTAAGLSHVKML